MKAVHWFYAGCAALVVVIYWTTITWPLSTLFNVAEYAFNRDEKWWQGWIGALSGWIAAAGALAAALLTLPHLKRQADEAKKQAIEAKRQADFALGDSLPTFDVYSEELASVYFRIVNWNRRTLLLDKIEYLGLNSIKIISVKTTEKGDIKLSKLDLKLGDEPRFRNAIRIPGFEDRTKPPHSCVIGAHAWGGSDPTVLKGDFLAVGRLLGEDHGKISIKATADIYTVDFDDP